MPRLGYEVVKDKPHRAQVFNPKTNRWAFEKDSSQDVESDGHRENVQLASATTSTTQHAEPPDDVDMHSESEDPEPSSYVKKKQKRVLKWKSMEKALLDVHTELSAPGAVNCTLCFSNLGLTRTIRCLDCGSRAFFCVNHYAEHHRHAPFHCPDVWNDNCYVPYQPDTPTLIRDDHLEFDCQRKTKSITVLGMRGRPQKFCFEFCTCEDEAVTLLRHGLWAASPDSPTLAFQLDLMEWLRALVLECQVSVKGFVDAIAEKADIVQQLNASKVSSLYQALVTDSFSQYMQHHYQLSHLHHIDSTLDDGTQCPACEGQVSIFSFDANFGLVRKKSSGKSCGEPFHAGRYFLNQTGVDCFMETDTSRSKKGGGDCNSFQAGNNLRSKSRTDKLDETGVFGCACRHEFPTLFLSLKHGERLGYAVYLMQKLLEENPPQKMYLMYDIACKLAAHLKKRPGVMGPMVEFVLPIFHSFGHKMSCQLEYGPRRCEGIGLTDGETMERLWSYLRKFSTITKQMTSQRRVDLLSEALLHYAGRQQHKFAKYLVQKKKNVDATYRECLDGFNKLRLGYEGPLNPATIETWRSEEKIACSAAEIVKTSTKDIYILMLHELYHKLSMSSAPGRPLPNSTDDIDLLVVKLSKMEIQHGYSRMAKDTEEYHQALLSAVTQKRRSLLERIRTVATERCYSLNQISEARGQEIYKKVSSTVNRLNKRMNHLLGAYNRYLDVPGADTQLPAQLTFGEAADLSNDIFSMVPDSSERKRKTIETVCTFKRCQEEQDLLIKDAKSTHLWYLKRREQCQQLRDSLNDSSRVTAGSRALLYKQVFRYELLLADIESVWFANLHEVAKPVREDVQVSQELPCEQDADLEEVSQLEMEEVMTFLRQGFVEDSGDDDSEDEEMLPMESIQ